MQQWLAGLASQGYIQGKCIRTFQNDDWRETLGEDRSCFPFQHDPISAIFPFPKKEQKNVSFKTASPC